ncbi:cob(I)yrinic acid a,c-diamide adenosyltransferase [candidate division WOR-3 bacterium]|uniref:Cob(I)yrinic acid a,c-diamide adenosyltransferase n=1 Tax=candidate division WOR-3 bacterium TaxID=2052148 RepID=A0A660SL71_UNCW3|nr:MAG: cob(I)yrinic acid a,c-diamide adenosyltransferase [candidate division WOR-3 bacterium]
MSMVQVYTGDGKGKTTAALGLALRAVGHGLKVLMIQFMKGSKEYGEIKAAEGIKGLRIEQFGRPEFVNPAHPDPEDIRLARAGLARAREAIQSQEFDLIILDEINVAIDFGLIAEKDVLELIENRGDTELVLTGRYAPPAILDVADLVTEMKEIKHYFRKGVSSRTGFDY